MSEQARDHAGVVQLMIVARHCDGPLSDVPALTAACATAVRDVGFQIVGEAAHAFTPHGATVALLLAQSHLIVSTWPEYRMAIVDVTICGPKDSALRLWGGLEGVLLPLACDIHEHRIDLTHDG